MISRRPDNLPTPEAKEWFRSYFNCILCRPAEGPRYCNTHDAWRAKLEEEGKIRPRSVMA